jgi:hypothetical protein
MSNNSTKSFHRCLCILVAVLTVLPVAIQASYTYRGIGVHDFYSAMNLGLGTVHVETLVSFGGGPSFGAGALVRAAIAVNAPQLVLSFTNFFANNLLTRMLSEYEWNRYASVRKGLRVSFEPQGKQRSSHFLQVPYRWGIPFMAFFGIFHWLLSESVFAVAIMNYGYRSGNYKDADPNSIQRINIAERDYLTVGFSPLAIMIVTFATVVFVLGFIAVGFLALNPATPLLGNCSAVIAAACHPEKTDGVVVEEEILQWGVTSEIKGEVGHCSFSAQTVQPLVEGKAYQ